MLNDCQFSPDCVSLDQGQPIISVPSYRCCCQTVQRQIGYGVSKDDAQLVALPIGTALVWRNGFGITLQQIAKRLRS
jgi:hypothetical protein